MKHYLALCCIAKDEEFFIEEWLCYHSLRGVEHFYIYDNMSALPLRSLPALQAYLAQGRITLVEVEGQGQQMPSYDHCLRHYGPECRWIGFIDLDEFIQVQRHADLRAFLSEFEPYAGLVLNWRIFGSNGHLSRPSGLVISNYTESLARPGAELHFKSLVDPRQTLSAKNPHTFFLRPGTFCVGESHLPVPAEEAFAPLNRERAWINHYYYRSQQDFERKVLRGRASVTPDQGGKRLAAFYEQAVLPSKKDRRLARFAPAVEEAMREKSLPLFMPDLPEDAGLQAYLDLSRELALKQKWEKAEITLCRAATRFADAPLLWLTRAFIARQKREYSRAGQFIHQALSLGELPQTYLELARLRMDQGQRQEAGELIFFLRHSPSLRVRDDAFRKELRELEKGLTGEA